MRRKSEGGRRRRGLPEAEELQALAIQYLEEGSEHEEASVLGDCTLELGEVKARRGTVLRIDITLRGSRKLVERLRPPAEWEDESALRRRIRLAIRNALPCGYDVATFGARAGKVTALPARRLERVNGARENGGFITLGRFGHGADFRAVRLDGEEFDLENRPMARCCLRVLVEQQAFDEASALHFLNDIHPLVQAECGGEAKEPRIHDYFVGKLEPLREKLVKAAGRKGRFYLEVN